MKVPNSVPQMKQDAVKKILESKGIDREKFPVCVLAVRGYYLDTMGVRGVNDRGIFDDAVFIDSPTMFVSCNWNTDPSSIRKGIGTGSQKGMATLKTGVWDYKIGLHKGKGPACRQAGPVTVVRDGINGDYEDTGDFAINHHWGSSSGGTSSAGCQTAPLKQWPSYINPLVSELKRYNQKTFKYVLIDEFERKMLLSEDTLLKPQPIKVPVTNDPINYAQFFNEMDRDFSKFDFGQSHGFVTIGDKFFQMGQTDLNWLSYIFATAMWETAHTMNPVTEYGSDSYLRGKRYWPYIGRGYVQITWKDNYAKYGIAETPEKALEPDTAAFIIVDGMVNGKFTGKKLSDYFNSKIKDPYNARRIVNGIDRANPIKDYYAVIRECLLKSV